MAAKLGISSKAQFAYSIYVSILHWVERTYLNGVVWVNKEQVRDANHFKVCIPVISLYIKQEPQSRAWFSEI